MVLVQMQRVHEEHGRVGIMATVSRRLLFIAAVLLLVTSIGINVTSGGSTLLIVALGLGLIFVTLAWTLFDAPSKPTVSRGSTPIKSQYSMGKSSLDNHRENQEQSLPDPLESGFDIPLM